MVDGFTPAKHEGRDESILVFRNTQKNGTIHASSLMKETIVDVTFPPYAMNEAMNEAFLDNDLSSIRSKVTYLKLNTEKRELISLHYNLNGDAINYCLKSGVTLLHLIGSQALFKCLLIINARKVFHYVYSR